jgi:hypothetical protein
MERRCGDRILETLIHCLILALVFAVLALGTIVVEKENADLMVSTSNLPGSTCVMDGHDGVSLVARFSLVGTRKGAAEIKPHCRWKLHGIF